MKVLIILFKNEKLTIKIYNSRFILSRNNLLNKPLVLVKISHATKLNVNKRHSTFLACVCLFLKP